MPYRRKPTPQEIMNVGPPADAGLERQKKEKPTIKPTVEVTQPKEAEVNFIESEFEKLENFSPIINYNVGVKIAGITRGTRRWTLIISPSSKSRFVCQK